MNDPHSRRRIDFIQEILSSDAASGHFKVAFKPDPRRYEWIDRDGGEYLHDKLDNTIMSKEEFFALATELLEGAPIFYQPSEVSDAAEYVRGRLPEIVAALQSEDPIVQGQHDKSDEFLRSLEVDELGFVVLSVDIVGSTKMATTLEGRVYRKIVRLVLNELSATIPKFHGHVLKYTGDGLIAYFPEPSFITKNDLALDCALTLLRLVREAINVAFRDYGFPEIQLRIGLDSGEAFVETIGSPDTKQHLDIIGEVVSLAAKIQGRAAPGEVCMGEATERNLHTTWRLACKPVELDASWTYENRTGGIYRMFRFVPAAPGTAPNS